MVSSAIDMDLEGLLEVLKRIRAKHADDPAYKRWRKEFPKSWPM